MKLLTSTFFKLVLLALCPLSLCSIVEFPRDTAALEGSKDVQLNCSVTQGSTLKWEGYFEWRLPSYVIYPNPTPSNPNFTTAQDGSSLYINTLTRSLAAIYLCNDESQSTGARVAAMQPLSCNQQTDMTTVTAGEPVVLNCSTSYESNVKAPSTPLRPTLALVIGNGTVITKTRAAFPGPLSISDNITATPEMDGGKVTCRLYFEDELQNSDVYPAPLYNDSCSFNLNVIHGVSWAKIITNLNGSNVVFVGDTITCEANGRPRPTIEWVDGNDTVISTGENLTMTMAMVKPVPTTFTCMATNTIPGPNSQNVVHTAKASIELIVSTPKVEEVHEGLASWAIALIVVIPLLVIILVAIVFIIMCLKKRNKDKPYKPAQKKSGKPDQSLKNLIYTAQAPNTGPGMAFMNSNQTKSPPLHTNYSGSPFPKNDYNDDFNRNVNIKANVGHGDLGMSGLSGSKAADLNMGSKGNLQEAGRQESSLSPRPPLQPYGGSSEGLNFPPLPPRFSDESGPKRGRQNHDKTRSPPPPPSYLDPGFGRQPSITSTSTNRSASSEGSRVAGRAVEKNPAGRQQKTGKKVTSPNNLGQGNTDGARRQGKKPMNNRKPEAGSDVHSLQGSEV